MSVAFQPEFAYTLLLAVGAFCRWRCVAVVLGELRGMWPGQLKCSESPDSVLFRAILDAVHGEPGYADSRIIRQLSLAVPSLATVGL